MATLSYGFSRMRAVPGPALVLTILVAITVVRLVGLRFSAVDLYWDEAQYWNWSRELAFGYFSKPPLLAWIIAAAEHVCGSGEACIRAPAPILYFGTSVTVYALARQLYDPIVAAFAALLTALSTGLVFSARIISTDVPLVFFWALALLAYVKMLAGHRPWAVVLGIALGFGFLAKYAMIYFIAGIALAAWLDSDARRLLRRSDFWLALAIAALIVAPNLIWNVNNGFVTLKHVGQNVQGEGFELNPLHALKFIVEQFAVFGPVCFAVLLIAIVRAASQDLDRADRLMLAFALPPLALVTAAGFVVAVHANWAAPAYISAFVLVAALLVRWRAWTWLAASLAIGVVAQAAVLVTDARAKTLHLPWLTKRDIYSPTLGWQALGTEARRLAHRVGARTIVADWRPEIAALLYYLRDEPEHVVGWPSGPVPAHHFDIARPISEAMPEPFLLITQCPSPSRLSRLSAYFVNVQPLGMFSVPTGPTSVRTYFGFKLEDRRGPIGPLGACR